MCLGDSAFSSGLDIEHPSVLGSRSQGPDNNGWLKKHSPVGSGARIFIFQHYWSKPNTAEVSNPPEKQFWFDGKDNSWYPQSQQGVKKVSGRL